MSVFLFRMLSSLRVETALVFAEPPVHSTESGAKQIPIKAYSMEGCCRGNWAEYVPMGKGEQLQRPLPLVTSLPPLFFDICVHVNG